MVIGVEKSQPATEKVVERQRKAQLGQFFTPPAIALHLLQHSGAEVGTTITVQLPLE